MDLGTVTIGSKAYTRAWRNRKINAGEYTDGRIRDSFVSIDSFRLGDIVIFDMDVPSYNEDQHDR